MIRNVRDHLRTAAAGGASLLGEPAAGRADLAAGQQLDDLGKLLHDAPSEAAAPRGEVRASMLLALRREAEHFRRLERPEALQEALVDLRIVRVVSTRPFGFDKRPLLGSAPAG
jgi:hypothetical protein